MPKDRSRALTESGITVALSVLLSLAGVYLPVFSAVITFLWPVPLAYLGVRHGLRWSVMATAAMVLLLLFFIGPVQALTLGLTFGTMGIALGYGFRQRWSGVRLLALTTVVLLLGVAVQFVFSFFIMGIDLVQLYQQTVQASSAQAFATLDQLGYNSIEMDQLRLAYEAQQRQLQLLVPFMLVCGGLMLSYFNILIAGVILRRLGVAVPKFPEIADWEMPRATLYLYIVVWVLQYVRPAWFPGVPEWPLANLMVLAMWLIWVQGVAVVFWWARRHPTFRWMRWVLTGLSFVVPAVMLGFFFAGLIDLGINYRKKKGSA